MKKAPQGPIKLDSALLYYIENNFSDSNQNDIFPDSINEASDIYEGLKKQVFVNKYERNSVARNKCLTFHKPICKVCDLNFYERYGKIGKGFMHVHHVIPISQIGKEYKVDYKKDLVPVCPNCHAMLHREHFGKEPTVEELRLLLKR